MEEVNRPTFSRLNPALATVCNYVSLSALRERLKQVQGFVNISSRIFWMSWPRSVFFLTERRLLPTTKCRCTR